MEKATPQNDLFEFDAGQALTKFEASGDSKQRSFQIHVTGGPVQDHRYTYLADGPLYFDLSTTEAASNKIAALDEHKGRAGYTEQISIADSGIQLTGKLLDFGSGDEIARSADQGFPWQASLGIRPGSVERLEAGIKSSINGSEVVGPAVILRNNVIRHISFTAEGADRNTSAAIFSANSGFNQNGVNDMTKENDASIEKLTARIGEFESKFVELSAKSDEVSKENVDLKAKLKAYEDKAAADAKKVREDAVTKLFSDLGVEQTDEQTAKFMALDDAAFATFRATVPARKETDDDLMTRFNAGDEVDDELLDVAPTNVSTIDKGRQALHFKAMDYAAKNKTDYLTAAKAVGVK